MCDEHVLITSKDFEPQVDGLLPRDWATALELCSVLDAAMFYNCGFDSGASIKHKHMQVIPYNSFHHG